MLTSAEQLVGLVAGAFFTVVASIVLYALLGVVLAALAVLIMARRQWTRRRHHVWNVLAKFHYLAIIVAFLFTMPLLGAVRSVDSMTTRLIDGYLQPTVAQQLDSAQQTLVALLPAGPSGETLTVAEATDLIILRLQYTPEIDEKFGESKAWLVSWLVNDVGRLAVRAMIGAMAEAALEQAGEMSSVEPGELEFSAAEIGRMDYSKLSTQIATAVDRSVGYYVDGFFLGHYLNLLLVFMFIVAFSVAEIAFYNLYWKRRRKFRQPPGQHPVR